MSKIVLSQAEKDLITKLNHPTYTADFVEEWVNYSGNAFTNLPASLQSMGAMGFYQAVQAMVRVENK